MAARLRQAAAAAVVAGRDHAPAVRRRRRLLRAGAGGGGRRLRAVWATARPLVGATGALIAVLIIDGMHYFQYTAVKFNHDVIQLPFWALAGYAFHAALKRGRIAHWLPARLCRRQRAVGEIFRRRAGGAATRCSCCSTATRGARWRRPGRGSRASSRSSIAAPHLVWLVADRFPAVRLCRAIAPRRCAAGTTISCIRRSSSPARSSSCCRRSSSPRRCCGRGRKRLAPVRASRADAFDRRIVTLLAFGPGLAMIALIAVSGRGTFAMWGYPLWLFRRAVDRADAARSARCRARLAPRGRALGRGVRRLRRRLHRQLLGAAAASTTAIARCSIRATRSAATLTQRFHDATGAKAALRHRRDVGRRQSRALFAGPAAKC